MSVAETRDKVQRILTKYLGSIMVDADGDFQVKYGSTTCPSVFATGVMDTPWFV